MVDASRGVGGLYLLGRCLCRGRIVVQLVKNAVVASFEGALRLN